MSEDYVIQIAQILQALKDQGALVEECLHHSGVPDYYDLLEELNAGPGEPEWEYEDLCIPAFFLTEELMRAWYGLPDKDDIESETFDLVDGLENMLAEQADVWHHDELEAGNFLHAPDAGREGSAAYLPFDCGGHIYDDWTVRRNARDGVVEYAVIDPAGIGCRAWRGPDAFDRAMEFLRVQEGRS